MCIRDRAFFAGAKVLDGRDWKQGDSFLFVIEKDDYAPATEKAETRAEALSDGQYTDGQQVPFDFGEAEFTKPGTYTYMIYEKEPDSKAQMCIRDSSIGLPACSKALIIAISLLYSSFV